MINADKAGLLKILQPLYRFLLLQLYLPLSCFGRLAHVLGQNFILSSFEQSAILQNFCFEQVARFQMSLEFGSNIVLKI